MPARSAVGLAHPLARPRGGLLTRRERLPPGEKRLAELLDQVWMLPDQVARFPSVFRQVVKLGIATIPAKEELPIGTAYGEVGPNFTVAPGPVRGTVPE